MVARLRDVEAGDCLAAEQDWLMAKAALWAACHVASSPLATIMLDQVRPYTE